ncbi:MAG: TIGR03668 family PPOX class F420-dependent oxidoreductase [Thermoplasmata archaeon]
MEWTESDVAFVRAQRLARMATVGRGGEPHVVPVCFAFDGASFYTATDQKPKGVPPEALRRLQNLRRDASVALLLDQYREDWSRLRYLLVRGEARFVEDPEERERAFRLLEEKYTQYREARLQDAGWPLIRIVPRRVHRWRAAEEAPGRP